MAEIQQDLFNQTAINSIREEVASTRAYRTHGPKTGAWKTAANVEAS